MLSRDRKNDEELFQKNTAGREGMPLLEGGYCYEDLGINIHAFCEGFQ